jgi:hypothetical protein
MNNNFFKSITNILAFKGSWDANSNTPELSDGGVGGNLNDFYIVGVSGTTSIDGHNSWEVGDWIIDTGTSWDRIPASNVVVSVAGKVGVVTLIKADVGLPNVDNTSDLNKPISTLTQSALDLKSDVSHNHNLNNLIEKSYNNLDDKPIIPDQLSDLSDDSTHRLVTDVEKSTWNEKQDVIEYTPANDSEVVHLIGNEIIQGIKKFGSSDGLNNSHFESDGTLVSEGNATTWVDIDFPVIIRTVGANIPTITTVKGNLQLPLWQVNDYFQFESEEIIHSYKQGSICYFHIHLVTNGSDVTDRYVQFRLEYNYANPGEAWKTNNIIVDSGDILIQANTLSISNLIFSIAQLNDNNLKIGSHIKCRLTRIASSGLAPSNNPFCEMMQMHVEQDTTGSRSITTK